VAGLTGSCALAGTSPPNAPPPPHTHTIRALARTQTIIPAGLKDRRQPSTGTPNYKWTGGRALNTSLLFDPMAGLRANETLDCAAVAGDMPNSELACRA
jgi:hypothetical protein